MLLLEIFWEFIVEVIFIELIGGTLSFINNTLLKLRGIETRSIEEIKFDKIKKRYEYKTVKLKRKVNDLEKGEKGIVLEIIDLEFCFVEFGNVEKEIIQIKLKDILITKPTISRKRKS